MLRTFFHKAITKQVLVISGISLANDAASEMLVPVLPLFFAHAGYSFFALGCIEGIADAVAGLGKIYFGALSDKYGKRIPYITTGYALSAISKPCMALVASPIWILFMRILDRVGKGVRTGARDALLNAEAGKEHKGRVFGFHRSMDTIGAVIGPLLALWYLHYHPQQYAQMFAIAIIPGIISIGLSRLLTENSQNTIAASTKVQITNFWPHASRSYKQAVVLLCAFALVNSSDAFLLLHLSKSGLSDTMTLLIYAAFNIVYVAAAYPMGIFADKIGMYKVLAIGFLLFASAYAVFAVSTKLHILLCAMIIYGIYAACTDGVAKALLLQHTKVENAGKAIGFFTAAQSACIFCASSITGILWQKGYASWSFAISAAISALLAIFLLLRREGLQTGKISA
jgi:MFS family permease